MAAIVAISTMKDAEFLTTTFTEADVVYVMEALEPGALFAPGVDVGAAVTQIGQVYKQVIQDAEVKRVEGSSFACPSDLVGSTNAY